MLHLQSIDGEVVDLELEKLEDVNERSKFLNKYKKGLFGKEGIFYDDLDDSSKLAIDNYLTNLLLKENDYHTDKILNKIQSARKKIENM